MANKKVRILVDQNIDGVAYRCNDVVDLSVALAKPLLELGAADDNKAAVAYCLNELGATVIVHQSPAVEEPAPPAEEVAPVEEPAPSDPAQ